MQDDLEKFDLKMGNLQGGTFKPHNFAEETSQGSYLAIIKDPMSLHATRSEMSFAYAGSYVDGLLQFEMEGRR